MLAELGHEVAPVTIDTADWRIVGAYVAALDAGDSERADELAAGYVAHGVEATRLFQRVARARVGRDVAHVLLLHANVLAADHIGAFVDALAAEG